MTQSRFVVPPTTLPLVPVAGTEEKFPVHRIYCVGKNYAAHVLEMGSDPGRQPPCFFMKPADAIVTDGIVPFPLKTENFHYEAEMVIAIGVEGANITPDNAMDHVYGYAVGIDLTRRDLQAAAVKASQPWDSAKGFDYSAPIAPIHPVSDCGHLNQGNIRLWLNDQLRQDADLSDLIWKPHEIIAALSALFVLKPGDLIFTGTPAGVGPLAVGDVIKASVEGLEPITVTIVQS